jgi:class 3 adenylate cyclase
LTDLPRGNVTFFFTDIEGSPKRWERDRTAMASVVECHLRPLREGVAVRDAAVRMSDHRTLIAGGAQGVLANMAAPRAEGAGNHVCTTSGDAEAAREITD